MWLSVVIIVAVLALFALVAVVVFRNRTISGFTVTYLYKGSPLGSYSAVINDPQAAAEDAAKLMHQYLPSSLKMATYTSLQLQQINAKTYFVNIPLSHPTGEHIRIVLRGVA